MAYLTTTQRTLAGGRGVFFARLVFLDISGTTRRIWEGFGPVVVDGNTFQGDGSLVSIGDIPF